MLRVLGPLEIVGPDGPVVLSAAKPRALLAALCLGHGRTRSIDGLLDALWGESPPASGAKLLQVYVSHLRKVLPPGLRIVTTQTGYTLELEPGGLDADTFEHLLAEGRAALEADNPAMAAAALSRGLALWRGPAYADVRYEAFAQEEADRLERLRDHASELRIDAELRLGRHVEVLGELRNLLAVDPTREELATRAMLAAYRSGRTSEALTIFATVRDGLARELGVEPGPDLVELRERISRRDPALDRPAGEAATSRLGPALGVPPQRLIGRHGELQQLRALLARPSVRLVSLTGAGGSGKTRLALELARELDPVFANGAVVVELAAVTDPDHVPAAIARALNVDPGRDASATIQDALANQDALLVLDNLEHLREAGPAIVRLLAAAPHLVVVATTRVVLHVSGEHVFPVAPLAEPDAIDLFIERARAHDTTFAIGADTEPLVASICRRVDRLPLAIELAAAGVRALGLRTVDTRLGSRLPVLAGGPRDLPARQRTLHETLAWSVNLLEPRQAQVLAALAVFPAGCSIDAAAAVAGADDTTLIALVDHHLLQAFEVDGERRFRLLETVRAYASELLGSRRQAAESALVMWMAGVVEAMSASTRGMGLPPPAALRKLDVEQDTLRAALKIAAREERPDRELAIASPVWHYWLHRGYLAEGRQLFEGILERRGLVRTRAGIRAARAAASFAWSLGDEARTSQLALDALEAAIGVGDRLEQAAAHNLLGVVATGRGEVGAAEAHLVESIRLAESDGDVEAATMPRLNLGVAYFQAGRLDDAREMFGALLDYRRSEGLTEGVGLAHTNLGETEYAAGNLEAAEGHFAAAVASFQAVGFKVRLAGALQGIAAVEAQTGRAESAARRLGVASALLADTGWAQDGVGLEAPATAAARKTLGDEHFDRLFLDGAAAGPE